MSKSITKFAFGVLSIPGFSMAALPVAALAQTVQQTGQPPKSDQSEVIFLGPDGEPLPVEQQAELRRKYGAMLPKPPPSPPENATTQGDTTGSGGITVSGERPRGAVIGTAQPLQIYSPLEIQAYGSNDIGELVKALGAKVSSDRAGSGSGPILLLNGKRIADVRQISKIPAEAIERLEIFPEELALSYGYRADQKVVNIVIFEKYRSDIGRLSFSVPSAGGQLESIVNANILRIRKDTRLTIDAGYSASGGILESERGILPPTTLPDERAFRTLVPANRRLTLDAAFAGNWVPGIDSSVYGHYEQTRLSSSLGLAPKPIAHSLRIEDGSLGLTFNGARKGWLWSFSGNFEHLTTTEAADSLFQPPLQEITRSRKSRISTDLSINGSPISLPVGAIRTSLRFGAEQSVLTSLSAQNVGGQRSRVVRDQAFVQLNLDIPLLARKGEVRKTALAAMGNVALENVRDFGTRLTLGAGLNWTPSERMNAVVSFQDNEVVPSFEQVGNPLTLNANGRILDFRSGGFVAVQRIFGGNPALLAGKRQQFRFGLALKPLAKGNLTLTLDYSKTWAVNPVILLDFSSTGPEAIVPNRFGRSPSGDLISVDSRPINFKRSDQEIVRWGIDFTHSIGGAESDSAAKTLIFSDADDLESRLPKGAIITRVQAGSEAARPFEQAHNRLVVTLTHTIRLRDTLLAPDGITRLDLLNGFAVGPRGGNARHRIQLQSGISVSGLNANFSASWNSGSFVRENAISPQASVNDLRFSDYLLVDFGVNVDLGDKFSWAQKSPFLRKTRLSFAVANLLDSNVLVRNQLSLVPTAYQPDYLDPLGRTVTLGIRTKF